MTLGTQDRASVAIAVRLAPRRAAAIVARLPLGAELASEVVGLLAEEDDQAGIEPELARSSLGGIHSSWVDQALEFEGISSLHAMDLASSPVRDWLRRAAFGHLVVMPEGTPPSGREPRLDEMPLYPSVRLQAAFRTVGRKRLALALAVAPRSSARAVAARLDPVDARFLPEDVKQADRQRARFAVRELTDFLEVLAGQGAEPARLLVAMGIRSVAPALGGDVAWQIAQRLPRSLGHQLTVARDEPLPVAECTMRLATLSAALAEAST